MSGAAADDGTCAREELAFCEWSPSFSGYFEAGLRTKSKNTGVIRDGKSPL